MRSPILLVTAITPAVWGTTYAVTTEFLPPGRPLLAGLLRALPAGLLFWPCHPAPCREAAGGGARRCSAR